jgi:hypothetical protein
MGYGWKSPQRKTFGKMWVETKEVLETNTKFNQREGELSSPFFYERKFLSRRPAPKLVWRL